ncbi:hypothetical protein SAMN05443572_110138 [Myxococcus fulvus]|uniref:B box-type domain-containing protein n=1 Tax=Myxococcus fulvus TaxID=33 RepID=A0A511T7V6_MYXFU|nr:hypothetical protein [Myxococcus fulvus]GEN10260.1 hypothetical protein MFU01_52970 [Myxococcus fulvus]SEU34850.1 hypothetical protein SAMN05443572_110138 [Myxococcus fulvus]
MEKTAPLEPQESPREPLPEGGLAQVRCACGAMAPRDAEFCPGCLGSLRNAVLASPPEPILAPTPEPVETAVAPEGPRCPRHPEVTGALPCPRCGGFFCEACLPDSLAAERTHCADCLARERSPEAVRRALFRDLTRVQVGVLVILVIQALVSTLIELAGQPVEMLLGSLCLMSPFVALTVLVAKSRSATVGWILCVIDVGMGLLQLFGGGSALAGAAILLAGVLTGFQLVKLRSLPRLTGSPD